MPKHVCPACTRIIRWALLLCFDCNKRLRESGGCRAINGQPVYPLYETADLVDGN